MNLTQKDDLISLKLVFRMTVVQLLQHRDVFEQCQQSSEGLTDQNCFESWIHAK